MTHKKKIVLWILGIVIGVPVALTLTVVAWVSLSDKTNGIIVSKPVGRVNVEYLAIDGDEGGRFSESETDGRFRMAVPVRTALVVIVSAPGYKGWVYSDLSNPSHPVLRLESGEQKNLDIQLEPLPKGSATN